MAEPLRPGPTLICAQSWDRKDGCLTPTVPERSALVSPEFGRLALFQGDLAHGVLQSGFEGKRITFLMNWWAAPPKDIQRPTSAYIADQKLAAAGQTYAEHLGAGIEGAEAALEDVRWWATPHSEAKREPTSGELVAASSLLCCVLEESSQPGNDLAAQESAAARRTERAAKLVESSDDSDGDVSWQAAKEKGGVVIIDHPGYMVYQTPQHEVVLLPTLM
jgi:hypothetical protein